MLWLTSSSMAFFPIGYISLFFFRPNVCISQIWVIWPWSKNFSSWDVSQWVTAFSFWDISGNLCSGFAGEHSHPHTIISLDHKFQPPMHFFLFNSPFLRSGALTPLPRRCWRLFSQVLRWFLLQVAWPSFTSWFHGSSWMLSAGSHALWQLPCYLQPLLLSTPSKPPPYMYPACRWVFAGWVSNFWYCLHNFPLSLWSAYEIDHFLCKLTFHTDTGLFWSWDGENHLPPGLLCHHDIHPAHCSLQYPHGCCRHQNSVCFR